MTAIQIGGLVILAIVGLPLALFTLGAFVILVCAYKREFLFGTIIAVLIILGMFMAAGIIG